MESGDGALPASPTPLPAPNMCRVGTVDASPGTCMFGSNSPRSTRGPTREAARVLSATAEGEREAAWTAFVDRYHPLLLRVARDTSFDYDHAMDRYAYVLEGLRKDDFRRLRGYTADPRAKFTTWLVVVARRLCVDYNRGRYGRSRPTLTADTRVADCRETRRRLTELVATELDPNVIANFGEDDAEAAVRRIELTDALLSALAELDTTEQLLLKLRFEDGLSAREIAGLLGMPTPFHVYRQIASCLKALRVALERLGVTDPVP